MHVDSVVVILAALAVVLIAAKLGAELLERIGQPAVLGELVAGIVAGGVVRAFGADTANLIFNPAGEIGGGLAMLATLGVILLLFDAGLESSLADMRRVGVAATLVAVIGVVVPVALGIVVSSALDVGSAPSPLGAPIDPFVTHLFIGATLAATSVGITARVFRDLHGSGRPEARIVLGAAVIDDILGLVLLAVIAGFVSHPGSGSIVSGAMEVFLTALAVLIGALLIGRFVVPSVVRRGAMFRAEGMPVFVALGVCFSFAALTGAFGLSPIVGAFAAGLVLEDAHFAAYRGERNVRTSIAPIMRVFAPVFFVWTGALVDVRLLADPGVLALGGALTAVAIVGKQACALVVPRGMKRAVVGLAMIPRGEVGLMFASVGKSLGVFGDAVFAAIVLVVMATTFATPPLLAAAIRRRGAP